MTRNVLVGRAGSPGVGLGRLLLVAPSRTGTRRRPASRPAIGATDPASERARLLAALDAAATDLEALARQVAVRAGDDIGAIFEAQALFARDPGIVGPALEAIDAGARADVAILDSTDEQAGRLAAVDDEYFRARAADVRDVGRRVADLLCGSPRVRPVARRRRAGDHRRRGPGSVGGRDPASRARRRDRPGWRCADRPRGDRRSRSRDPARARPRSGARAVHSSGVEAIVDGRDPRSGRLIVEPSDDELATPAPASEPTRRPRRRRDPIAGTATSGSRSAPTSGPSSRPTAAVPGWCRWDRPRADRAPVPRPPGAAVSRRATRDLYARIRDAFPDQPVVFRTLDVGGDKPAAWQSDRAEANPALGLRGVRLGLDRPALLDDQLTALLERGDRGEVRIMLPMVVDGRGGHRRPRDARRDRGDDRRRAPAAVRLGVMIEVPSAALDRRRPGRGRRLLQHRHERPGPVHARRRPDQPGRRRAGDGAPAGRAAADRRGRAPRHGLGAGTSPSAARPPPIPT